MKEVEAKEEKIEPQPEETKENTEDGTGSTPKEIDIVLDFKSKEELFQTWMSDKEIQDKYRDVKVMS